MCRFAAYLGPRVLMSTLVTEPTNSIIHQSFHCEERREPLNGDGFGVAWYNNELSYRPALFKDVTPAWNNANLKELARVTESTCILAHVRAASPNSSVHRLNCHPFVRGRLAFMHNGFLGDFVRWKRRVVDTLSEEAYLAMEGSTDSEHALSVLWDIYQTQSASMDPMERLSQSLLESIRRLETLKRDAGVSDISYLNFALTDGERLVACRYGSKADDTAASLYYTTGHRLCCDKGRYRMEEHPGAHHAVVVASEKLSPDFSWTRVPANHLVRVAQPAQVEVLPMVGPGLPEFPAAPRTTMIQR